MTKWGVVKMLLAVMVVVGAITAMTYEEKQATIKYQRQCQEHISQILAGKAEKDNASRNECKDAKDYMPWWYILIAWPDGIGVWAIIATGIVIGWQGYETRRAANVMHKQTEIQLAGLQQWIDVETSRMHANFEKSIVNLHFRIVNNTDYPLTIQKIVTKATFCVDWEVFTITTNVTIPPRQKTKSEGYPFYVSMNLKKAEMEWIKNGTIVTINGEIGFLDCLQRPDSDYFGGLYRVKEQVFEYLEPVGIKPDHTTEHHDRNPN
jgi:hypothetical protein